MNLRFALASIVLLTVAACGGGYSGSTPTSPSTGGTNTQGTPVSIVSGASVKTNTAFAPNPVVIAHGGTVTWTNNDNTTHTSSADDGSWNSGTSPPARSSAGPLPTRGLIRITARSTRGWSVP